MIHIIKEKSNYKDGLIDNKNDLRAFNKSGGAWYKDSVKVGGTSESDAFNLDPRT